MIIYKYLCIFTLLILLGPACFTARADAPDVTSDGTLTINIKGIQTDQAGQLILYIYQGEDNWLESERASHSQILNVDQNDSLSATFTDVPMNQDLAIQIIHDQNRNAKLDFQWFPPKPEEGVGVSNNRFRMGPPDYNDAKIILHEQTKTIQIEMHY